MAWHGIASPSSKFNSVDLSTVKRKTEGEEVTSAQCSLHEVDCPYPPFIFSHFFISTVGEEVVVVIVCKRASSVPPNTPDPNCQNLITSIYGLKCYFTV